MPLKKLRRLLPLSAVVSAIAIAPVAFSNVAHADPAQITVHVDRPGVKISPDMYGLMTEEINHAYDGGLYGELIQNRVFKDNLENPVHWSVVKSGSGSGWIALDPSERMNSALTTSLKLHVSSAADGAPVGIANDGFWGIPVKPDTKYTASFYAKASDGFDGPLMVGLESADGATTFASAKVSGIGNGWKQYSVTLKTGHDVAPSLNNRFVITATHPGSVNFTLVSLFPPTYKNRANGNRIDLMEKIGAMNPAFLRLPGGNYVDPGHYQWKITIGPVDQRPGDTGAWGYRTSDGIGILEYCEWCEDLNMQPLLAVTDGRPWLAPGGDVAPLVQDALDEIEYVSGDKSTPWGAKRAKDGHSAPFPLKYVEIGNEDFFDRAGTYDKRFAQFFDAIRAKYPNLKIIATRGDVKSRVPDIIDEHYYRSATAMQNAAHQYDAYPRTGPKIFVGEWATTEGSPTPTQQAAIADAAWMTGMERNADIVILESYAPLLVNVNPGARQWGTNLIGYDALNSFGSPSYYVQKMFATNHGDVALPTEVTQSDYTPVPVAVVPRGGVGVGTWATQAEFSDMKVVGGDGKVLFQTSAANPRTGLHFGDGTWSGRGGMLRQTGTMENTRATTGDNSWGDYTYTLKAKKTGGDEGFLVLFHAQGDDNYLWWNIGGWQNSRTAIEKSDNGSKTQLGPNVPVTIETGKTYDIRIEVKGTNIRCYLDDKLVEEVTDAPTPPAKNTLFASAVRDTASGDLFLRVVNAAPIEQSIQINLAGATSVAKTATGEVIAGDPTAVNTVEEPTKVAPQPVTIDDAAPTFTRTFPAHSVTVVRLKVK